MLELKGGPWESIQKEGVFSQLIGPTLTFTDLPAFRFFCNGDRKRSGVGGLAVIIAAGALVLLLGGTGLARETP